jgi:hypothetical protein
MPQLSHGSWDNFPDVTTGRSWTRPQTRTSANGTFVGSEYHLEVGGDDFYLDMLFYHLLLRCYVIIELKITDFKPEHAGKLNFYLSAVDDLLRAPGDGPSIGLVLCKGKNRVVAEYALRDLGKPIGVSEIKIRAELPRDLLGKLPSVEELETELNSASPEAGPLPGTDKGRTNSR